ncbi:MAG: L-seryl-tRNA(Sec) selenium transferase [Rhodospirillaceae bacterium]|nr:L-seryl-tRNA(Sec) selenium transferase [Rhodospirillaceae bacterium]
MDDGPQLSRKLLRQLPAIDKWLASECGSLLSAEFSIAEVTEVMREHLARVRRSLGNGLTELPDFQGPQYAALMRAELLERRLPSLRHAINATGIVLHTNLGRAPLAAEAVQAMEAAAAGYSNLEFDLGTGERGSRQDHVESLLCRITGAEAALAVNNCAAAVMLALESFAADGEVIVSRGELVEIGGSFRMPDVIAKSGARMVEVGTTNKTRLDDYAAVLSDRTRIVLAVHPSNFRIVGFSAKPALKELAKLAHTNELLCVHDLGSGALANVQPVASMTGDTIQSSLAAGVDLVTFSGDKLLGGPQAGMVVGSAELIDTIRRNPLARVLRIDKLSLAALAATLQLYLPPNDPAEKIPILRMLGESESSIAKRARRLLKRLREIPGMDADIVDDVTYSGGGALPMVELPTKTIRVTAEGVSAGTLAGRLREAQPPVIARLADDRLVLDPRTMLPGDSKDLLSAFRQALG